MTGGSHLSAREREGAGYRFGFELGGLRAASGAGPNGFPGALLYFYFSFALFLFCFLYFFTPFSNLIQIELNQLCKVSKIQNNNTEQ
jgi:hypothetical protein